MFLVSMTNTIYAQLTPSGSETVVNSTTVNNQQRPNIAMDNSGNYVVVWESLNQDGDGYGIYFQRYNNLGVVQGSETKGNTTTSNDQRFPSVAMDGDGDFVITWQSYNQDGSSWGIYFQRFNSSGVAQGSETLVNSTTTNRQVLPKVAMDDSGKFGITWESDGDIYAALFNADGTSAKSEFIINTTTSNKQTHPDIAMDSDGDFVIVWQSYNQDGDGFGVYGQRYNASGAAQSSNFLINTTTSGQQVSPNVAMDSDGDFVVTWVDDAKDGSSEGIYHQRYNAVGTTQGSETKVNTTTSGSQGNPNVAMNSDGAFVIVWNSFGQDGQFMGVYHQSYFADGTTSGNETLANTTTNYFQQFPKVTINGTSQALIIWQDGNYNEASSKDASSYGVVFQRYSAAALPVELLYFYGKKEGKNVRLDWQTATEINNSHFDVEWSMDGIDFEKIGEIAGAGTTTEVQFYDFLHLSPILGQNYYRLKQVDLSAGQAGFDEKYEYTDILNIEYQMSNIEYRIFPNPATDYIVINGMIEGEMVQIFNINGQLIKEFQHQSSMNNLVITDLPSGTYFIMINNQIKKLIIEK